MKILYAIQGTGNGHLTRAKEIIPALKKKGEVDLLISGIQVDLSLPYEVKYRYHGLSFIFGKKGGIDFLNTFKRNEAKRFVNEVSALPVNDYDLIISDFEPVSSWASYFKNKTCIGLSNQLATLSPDAPKARHEDPLGKFILKHYAPHTSGYGIHFQSYNENIFTPIIRQEIRNATPRKKDFYLVYLPAYRDQNILKVLANYKQIHWEVFSKHTLNSYSHENINVYPVQEDLFIQKLINCRGAICAAGFATPSEALYLRKKLLVIPMKHQYEQQCNAVALKEMGVPVIKSLKKKHWDKISAWIDSEQTVEVHYPDNSEQIISKIFNDQFKKQLPEVTILPQNLDAVWSIIS